MCLIDILLASRARLLPIINFSHILFIVAGASFKRFAQVSINV